MSTSRRTGAGGKYPKLSERRACLLLGVASSTMRYAQVPQLDETALRQGVMEAVNLYGHHGFRPLCDLLKLAGCNTSEAVVRRSWRQEGLKVAANQPAGPGCGCVMAPISGYALRLQTTFEAMNLCRAIPTVPDLGGGPSSAFWWSSMSTPGSA